MSMCLSNHLERHYMRPPLKGFMLLQKSLFQKVLMSITPAKTTVRSDYGTEVGKVELLALVKLLSESGAHPDTDTATPEGVTPLNFSIAKGDVSLVKLLLKHGADINTPNGIGMTPLFRAIQDGSEEIFQAFLFANPNLSTRCLNNSTLLHAAARGENDTILSTLLQKLDAHRDKDVEESSISVDTTDDAGEAPLHVAAERGCVKVTRTLLTHGANIDLRDNAYVTPLIEAMSHEREDMVNFLKSQGANLSIVHEFRFLKTVDDPGKRAILYIGLLQGLS
ncbi:hypothetical protein SNK03_004427 [Fusarium graminearum]